MPQKSPNPMRNIRKIPDKFYTEAVALALETDPGTTLLVNALAWWKL